MSPTIFAGVSIISKRFHEKMKVLKSNRKLKHFLDNYEAPAVDRDECGERLNALFKNIEKFL